MVYIYSTCIILCIYDGVIRPFFFFLFFFLHRSTTKKVPYIYIYIYRLRIETFIFFFLSSSSIFFLFFSSNAFCKNRSYGIIRIFTNSFFVRRTIKKQENKTLFRRCSPSLFLSYFFTYFFFHSFLFFSIFVRAIDNRPLARSLIRFYTSR